MNFIALKMLLADRAKYIGIVIGLTFASFLVTWPRAIFTGVMSRTFSFVTDVGLPDIWVVDPTVQYIEDVKPMRDTEVLRVRGAEGAQWAVGLYKGILQARMDDGTFQNCTIVGLDQADFDKRFLDYIEHKKQAQKIGANIETRLTTPDLSGLMPREADISADR